MRSAQFTPLQASDRVYPWSIIIRKSRVSASKFGITAYNIDHHKNGIHAKFKNETMRKMSEVLMKRDPLLAENGRVTTLR